MKPSLLFPEPNKLYNLLCDTLDLASMVSEIDDLIRFEDQLTYEDPNKEYRGQTVLHIAIARGEFFLIQKILKAIKSLGLEHLFSKCVTGNSPNYLCLLGETPLASAFIDGIINGETGHFSLLLENGADICQTNSKGDTVLHSIIRVSPMIDVNMLERLEEMLDIDKLAACTQMKNKEQCTPLQLAFNLPVVPMINWLIEKFHRRSVFFNGNRHIEAYNVTVLDSITHRVISAKPKDNESQRSAEDWSYKRATKPKVASGLEMMFANNFSSKDALDLMDVKCIRFLVNEKWMQERGIFLVFGIFYFLALMMVTAYSMNRKDNVNLTDSTAVNHGHIHNLDREHFFLFSTFALYLSSLIGVVAFLLSTTLLTSRLILKPNPITQTLHNLDYTVLFIIFTTSLMLDNILVFIKDRYHFEYNGELLLVSMIFGWSFATMFLRIFLSFGHLIDLIRQVIIRHILSFLCMTAIINISFATCFFDLMRYVKDDTGSFSENKNFSSMWRTLYTMFTVTLGLSEFDSVFNSRQSWFAVLLFIIFMVVVYLLILNFLIAVMTETCTRIFSRRNEQQIIHKLSSMLFIEDMFLLPILFLPPLPTLRVKGISRSVSYQSNQSSVDMSVVSDVSSDVTLLNGDSYSFLPSFELCFRRNATDIDRSKRFNTSLLYK